MRKEIRKTTVKKRRRVKWGRVLAFAMFAMVALGALGWCAYSAWVGVRGAYDSCAAFVDEFQNRKATQARFQEERFGLYTNLLILGIDDGDPGQPGSAKYADTVILASVRHTDGFVRLLSVPGDTLVRLPGRAEEEKISGAYYYGGAQLAVRTVEEFLQASVHHYIVADWRALSEMIDVLGGIDLYVESDMQYEDSYADLKINLKQGYRHLDGEEAAQYVRYRSDELGDVGRVQRQQKFLQALYDQFFRADTMTKLPTVVDVLNRRVQTSMAMYDAARVVKDLAGVSRKPPQAEMLPGSYMEKDGVGYWKPDAVKMQTMLGELFQGPQPENTGGKAAE